MKREFNIKCEHNPNDVILTVLKTVRWETLKNFLKKFALHIKIN